MNTKIDIQKPKTYLLPADEVHIWSASFLEHKEKINYLKSILTSDEQERARSFKFPKDQTNYILARGILRCLLASYLGKPPQFIELVYGLWGKPYLLEELLHFNVSHSGDHVLYAFVRQYDVGIDIEYINKNLEIETITRTIFSPAEESLLNSIPLEERIRTFFRLWVCKEAYLKALGKGWLENKEIPWFNNIFSEKNFAANFSSSNTIISYGYPYCFEIIPNYASALFVKGPALQIIYDIFI